MTTAVGAGGRRPCVLVTDGTPSGQSRSTLAAVRALHADGYRVAVTVGGKRSLAASSRSCWTSIRVPAADEPAYARHVVALAEELGAIGTFPSSDAAVLALDAPGAALVDKAVLDARAEAAGLRRPRSRVFPSGAALVEARHEVPLPAVVKVSRKDHVAGRAAHVVRTPADLVSWDGVGDPVVVEELLIGPMTAVFGLVADGDLRAVGMQAYLRTWPVECGVGCAAVSVVPDADLVDRVASLVSDHDGVFQAQFVDRHLIDLNPRVYGSMPLALRAGVNLPARWCDIRLGRAIPRLVQARAGARYRWLEGEVRWAAASLRRGDVPALAPLVRPRRGTVHSVWSLHDPGPALTRLGHALSRRPSHDADHAATQPAGSWGLTAREADLVAMPGGMDTTVPASEVARRRLRAAGLVGPLAERLDATVRDGVLGPAWSSDIDMHVGVGSRDATAALEGHPHLLAMDALVRRLGSTAEGQWAVHDEGRALARLDVHGGPAGDTIERLGVRLRSGPVGTRQVLELRRVLDVSPPLPASVRRRLARHEARVGGGLLQHAAPARAVPRLGRGDVARRLPRLRRRRMVVALSGLDGAGKSSQVRLLRMSLEALGIPVEVAWERPGMGLEWLAPLRRVVKRLTGQATEPGVRAVGRGDQRLPLTRRGVLGRLWVSMVLLSYLGRVRRPTRLRRGVVLHDRHLLDAVATLEAIYGDAVMSWHRRLVLAGHPRADLTVLLDVPLETAAARKPDSVFSRRVLAAQEQVYAHASALVPDVVVLDGTRPTDALAADVLALVLGSPS